MQCMSVTTAIMFTTCEYHFGNVRSITFTFRLFIWVCLLSDAKPRIQLFDTQCIKKCLWIVVRRSLWWNTISMVSTVSGCAKHAFYDFIVCNAVVDINGLTWTNHMGAVVQDLNVSPAIFIRLGKCPPPPPPPPPPRARFTNNFFSRNSNSMETSPCCNSVAGHQIETNFCTCQDSTAVVPYTKFCSEHRIRNR